jgi:post-segregation antitoxin (ccd killing protein)
MGLQTSGELPMRRPLYDVNARRKTVSVTMNADLVAKAAALGINISRTAETAVIQAFEAAEKARIREEIREAVRITDELVAQHGLPFPEFGPFSPDQYGPDEESGNAA